MSELFGKNHVAGGPTASANVVPQLSGPSSRSGGRRAIAIAVGAVLLSGGGVGAAYGVSAAASHGSVPASDDLATRMVPAGPTLPSRTLPVTAGVTVRAGDLDARVDALVSEAQRVVAERAEAERRAAEDAERAARAAHQRAKAADRANGDGAGKDWGGCSGKHDDAPPSP